ncbi:MBL fold metallo-hydrolase [Bremerella cremea]|uniref:MBL fold metallo-hydrolase n=1 Tax=Bremerella cremea TaxID=1031537 RepID=UPI0031E8C802
MLLKYFYDKTLAHASYLVGCQRAKVAIVVDPGRDVQQYIETAKKEGLEITAVTETHIHADYVSGARELAERVGAKLYLSDEGPAEWKYEYAASYDHQLLHNGDHFLIGNIRFDVMHTPGHTPESISLLLTDQGGGANRPMGIFTGDFVFVNAVGRPDLLEKAAGLAETAKAGAADLFASLESFKQLPDYLQVWPAHGAGSACGKGLGAIPSSTVGYEKLFNPGLQFNDESSFVDYVLADQPEVPPYFKEMKRVNKEGPRVLEGVEPLDTLPATYLSAALEQGTLLDLSASAAFGEAHVPGSTNIPLKMLGAWGGWLVDYSGPVYLIGTPDEVDQANKLLLQIGVEDIRGYFQREDLSTAMTEAYQTVDAAKLSQLLSEEAVELIDVRSVEEWNAGHIAAASHHFLGRLPETTASINSDRPVVVNCRSGARSAIAVSVLQAAGIKNAINLEGGILAWNGAKFPTVTADAVSSN